MTDTIVIYHGGCRDGFCAAWIVNKYLTHKHNQSTAFVGSDEITYHPGFYGQEPPDCKDKNVIIVDFCYSLEVMESIVHECKSLVWLDHHKTAQPVADWFEANRNRRDIFVFDNNRSGAGITWDYFFPNQSRPWLVDYVEDRDLWVKKLLRTNEINAYITCLEFDFKVWDSALTMTNDEAYYAGQIAVMKIEQYIREVCKNVYFASITKWEGETYPIKHKYRNIPTVNIPQVDCSEVMENLLKLYPDSPFSLYWFKRQDGMYQYGMRSRNEFDVSTVAKLFGGGGHKNAAGFQLNYLLEELK